MLRDELCGTCRELLKDKVIVDPRFMKYLFIKADLSVDELDKFQEELEKIEYDSHNHIHKQVSSNAPTFRVDTSKGEGKASVKELAFRQEMLDRLKEAFERFNPIKKNRNLKPEDKIKKLKPITDVFIKEVQDIIRRFLPDLYNESQIKAEKKLKEKGFTVEERPQQRKEAYEAMLKWYLYKAEMNGEYLRMDLTNRIYGNNYFVIAYGNES